jgi:hypothetical protein
MVVILIVLMCFLDLNFELPEPRSNVDSSPLTVDNSDIKRLRRFLCKSRSFLVIFGELLAELADSVLHMADFELKS